MIIKHKTRFSTKAEVYARYRWDYAPEAIQTILDTFRPSQQIALADIGAGTGILTQHFVDKLRRVYAIEPNPEMRSIAERELSSHASFRSLSGSAEATTLPDNSVDLITVAQALHWCDPEPSVREFRRIARPNAWLAIIWNTSDSPNLKEALETLQQEIYGWDTKTESTPRCQPYAFYFGHERYREYKFPITQEQTWEQFFGSLCSNSHAPDPGHPAFLKFETAASKIFNTFSGGEDTISAPYRTELVLGKLSVTEAL